MYFISFQVPPLLLYLISVYLFILPRLSSIYFLAVSLSAPHLHCRIVLLPHLSVIFCLFTFSSEWINKQCQLSAHVCLAIGFLYIALSLSFCLSSVHSVAYISIDSILRFIDSPLAPLSLSFLCFHCCGLILPYLLSYLLILSACLCMSPSHIVSNQWVEKNWICWIRRKWLGMLTQRWLDLQSALHTVWVWQGECTIVC